jgi:S-DNA-T family DNA segregation ATPase FtsK/SpoIIIE
VQSHLSPCTTRGVVSAPTFSLNSALDPDAGEAITIAPPPDLPEPPTGGGWAAVLPAVGAIGMSAYAVLSGRLLVILLGIAGSGATVVVALATRRAAVRRWRATCTGQRTRYLEHLAACRDRAMAAADRQRTQIQQRCPAPGELPGRPSADAWEVRLGIGRVPLDPPVRPPAPPHPSALPWPELAAALAEVVTEVATVDDCPVLLDLAAAGPLGLVGPVSDSRALVRAIRVQASGLRVIDGVPTDGLSVTNEEPMSSKTLLSQTLSSATLMAADAPTVVLAETLGGLPPGMRTIGSWNADGSLTLRTASIRGTATSTGRRIVARPDRINEAEADRLAGLQSRDRSTGTAQATARSDALAPLGVVLGTTEAGDPVILDLAETALGGDGPHGWVVGATGTGKSQLLRRLVVGLAADRSPDDVAFVLVDFKGGAAFDDVAALPHVAGVLTNLDDHRDQGDVQRLIAALQAEVRHRQKLLRSAGVPDVTAYQADRQREPLPHLVVVVDEAAELLGACPEVLDIFATIGRVGRSLGIHLLLAAQRPEEARLRSLEGALRFRICLRTLTATDSIAVVRDPGAAALPAAPGWALLAVDGAPQRFRVTPVETVPAFTCASRTRPVWHPPLPTTAPMALPPIATEEPSTAPSVLLGLGDAPLAQWQGPVSLALAGSAGHLAVVGAPRTGRTSALRTVAAHAAALVAPSRLHLYVVGADPELQELAGLPQTGAVAHPADEDHALDVVSTVVALLAGRQRQISDRVRQLRRPADVVLLIDDWPQVRAAVPDLEPLVQEIAVAGLAVGIHLVLSAHRWSDLRAGLRDCIGSRIELHLPDPLESLLPRTFAGPPAGRPGRGVLLAGQLASDLETLPLPLNLQLAAPTPGVAEAISQRWSSHPATVHRVQSLPLIAVRPAGAPSSGLTSSGLALGIGSAGPVTIDLAVADRHLLVVGDPGSGRSTVLGAVGRELAASNCWDCWLVDPRGSLRAAGLDGDRIGRTPAEIETLLSDLHHQLVATLDGHRSARRTLLLVDDLDIATALTSPGGWSALASLLPLAADLQMTVAVARRCAGMARAAYDAFLGALREAGATGVLLAGSPDEGPIVSGVRCRPGPVGRALLVRPGEPPRPLLLYSDRPSAPRNVARM